MQDSKSMAVRALEGDGDSISRKMVIEFIDYLLSQPCKGHTGDFVEGMRDGYYRTRSGIKYLPSAQPQRKKGKWIPVDSFSAFGGDEAMWMAYGNPVAFYYCSECKEQAYAGEDGESLLTDFCPSCGADMRGESDE